MQISVWVEEERDKRGRGKFFSLRICSCHVKVVKVSLQFKIARTYFLKLSQSSKRLAILASPTGTIDKLNSVFHSTYGKIIGYSSTVVHPKGQLHARTYPVYKLL